MSERPITQYTLLIWQTLPESTDLYLIPNDKLSEEQFKYLHEAQNKMVDHYILRDMNDKLNQYHALSEKQVAFAFKLAKEVQEKALMPAEVMIAAPIGKERTTIRGRLISRKAHESQFGIVLRMTVKVETDAGNWLCNGTCPNELYATNGEVQIGCFVQFDAMLVPGREPHFAFFKRPTQARVISEEEYRKPLVVVEKVKGKRAKKDKTDLVVIDLDD